VQDLEIPLDKLAHVRTQNLDHDFASVFKRRRMNLRDRGGGERRHVEAAEQLSHRTPERFLDAGPRGLAGEGRHAILQLRELVRDVVREQVAPRRDHLAELDEYRPEILERPAQTLAA
jgi:hypothetical protein